MTLFLANTPSKVSDDQARAHKQPNHKFFVFSSFVIYSVIYSAAFCMKCEMAQKLRSGIIHSVCSALDWHAGYVPASPNYLCSRSVVQSLSSCCAFVSEQISQYPSVSYHFSATTEHLNAFVCVVGSYVNTAVTVSSPGREQSLRCKGLDSMTVIRRSGRVPFHSFFRAVQW